MDFQFSSILITFLLISLFILVNKYGRSKTHHDHIHINQKLPPGPLKLPLIGNLHKFLMSPPHHALRELARKHGPLMQLQLGEIPAVVVSSPRMAREVMKTHDLAFAQRPELVAPRIVSYGGINIAFSPYGDYWRQMRKICISELLSAKKVQSFSSLREDEVSNLVEYVRSSAGSEINFCDQVYSMTSTMTSRAVFGDKCKDHEEFLSLSMEAITIAGGFDLSDLFPSLKFLHLFSRMKPKLVKIQKKADKILDNIINEHIENNCSGKRGKVKPEEEEDLLDVLLKLKEIKSPEFSITNNNIKAVIWDMFSAATDTSSTTIEWAMAEMMKNPRVIEKAQAEVRQVKARTKTNETEIIQELGYLKSVIKETLRLHPAAALIPRECRELCEIDGYAIPAKTEVIINAWAIGRDPEYWEDAERFLPERFHGSPIDYKGTNYEYIPFGAGRRICPGISFGPAIVELALAELLYHFNWKLPGGIEPEDLDMTEAFGATVRRRNKLHLIATPYIATTFP